MSAGETLSVLSPQLNLPTLNASWRHRLVMRDFVQNSDKQNDTFERFKKDYLCFFYLAPHRKWKVIRFRFSIFPRLSDLIGLAWPMLITWYCIFSDFWSNFLIILLQDKFNRMRDQITEKTSQKQKYKLYFSPRRHFVSHRDSFAII